MVEWGKKKSFSLETGLEKEGSRILINKVLYSVLNEMLQCLEEDKHSSSPVFLYDEFKICYTARGQSNRFWQILQQVLEIHHITCLLFCLQATISMSTMSCSIPWITLCHHPCIEIIIMQPLPFWPVLSGENVTQLVKRKKSSPVTAAMRPSKEMREARIFQTAGLSLRSPCVVHQWAQTINTLPFLGSKPQPLS